MLLLLLVFFQFCWATPESHNSPTDKAYVAQFPSNMGSVDFRSKNGTVHVTVKFSGLPSGGPFMYHIHERPVPSNGDCYGTLDNLNPYGGLLKGSAPNDMQIGDLSGKHGLIDHTPFRAQYYDQYLSLSPTSDAFVGKLSVVVHFMNTSRIMCANITEYDVKREKSGAGRPGPSMAMVLFAAYALM